MGLVIEEPARPARSEELLWRFRLLGELRVESARAPAIRTVSRFRTQKTAALLAYLAFHVQRTHPREVLIDLFWPDSPSDAARNSLSQALSSLRRQLEPPGVVTSSVLIATPVAVGLNPTTVTVDVREFEALLRQASRTAPGPARRLLHEQAVAMYQGELLSGHYDEWIPVEQRRLADLMLQACLDLVANDEAAGDGESALRYARRILELDPLSEPAFQVMMRIHAAAGRQTAALEQYQALQDALRREDAGVPSESTRQLARQIEIDGTSGPAPARAIASDVPPPGTNIPTGTVTFLLVAHEQASVQGSTDGILGRIAGLPTRNGGNPVDGVRGVFTFARPTDALRCAVAIQEAAAAAGAGLPGIALHTREVRPRQWMTIDALLRPVTLIGRAAQPGQILCSAAAAALLEHDPDPRYALRDLGAFRLEGSKDGASGGALPEILVQIDYPKMPDVALPKALPAFPGSLPPQVTRFFGREAEIERLVELLSRQGEEERLVTLTGSGGTGKTRLALEVARRSSRSFLGAVWHVALADVTRAERILDAIIDAMCLSRSGSADMMDLVAAALSRQPSLLILDNLEQILPDAAPIVERLLNVAPTVRVLATSRQRLDLEGEREFPVPPLDVPAGARWADTPARLGQCESVQLFVDRAQNTRPDFQVTAGNAAAVAELCVRLEGIPLAIELAAGRSQVISPAQMLEQLGNRFDLLVAQRRRVAARHRTLRSAIDWSYQLLAPDLQHLLAGLSVFRGGWTVEAAAVVCLGQAPAGAGGDRTGEGSSAAQALSLLESLRECSLILADDDGSSIRFRMLESLREFARGQLPPQDLPALQRRHAHFFLGLAEAAEPCLRGPDQPAWSRRLELEHDNLRAALAWSESSTHDPDDTEIGLRLAGALWRFWQMRGSFREGREALSALLDSPGAMGMTPGRATALHGSACLAYFQSDYPEAQRRQSQYLEITRVLGDRGGVAGALNGLGSIAYSLSRYDEALSLREQSLAIWRELGDEVGTAITLNNISLVHARAGNFPAAREAAEEALAINRRRGDRDSIAYNLGTLGLLAVEQQDWDTARPLLEECIVMFREVGNRLGVANNLGNLAAVTRRLGDDDATRRSVRDCLLLCEEMENPSIAASALATLARIHVRERKYLSGARLLSWSRRVLSDLGHKPTAREVEEDKRDEGLLRDGLGPSRFATLWSEARTMTLTQAIDAGLEAC